MGVFEGSGRAIYNLWTNVLVKRWTGGGPSEGAAQIVAGSGDVGHFATLDGA